MRTRDKTLPYLLFGVTFLAAMALVPGPNRVSSAERASRQVEVVNNSLSPSSELWLRRGEAATFKGTTIPLTVRLKNVRGRVDLPPTTIAKKIDTDLVFPLKEGEKVTVIFSESGDYGFRIDGLNPGQRADKCGVDVLPHSVGGVIRVRE